MSSLVRLLGVVALVALYVVVLAALFSFPVKWLWNWLMPLLFGLREINVFQAWGLLTLCGFLLRSSANTSSKD